ncbi:MAG: hypothetical protein OQK75_03480 [Gammaproteobacteria bacterium]|nr:hypothetical protein [Gammaproteobacteria bacterium]MCW8986709.1 hypothetical protein [Gammaproteobacteria bacterium]
MENLLSDTLESTFFNIIIVGAALSMLYGFWLIISPKSALTLNQKINKSFSMREATRPLEKPITVERWFYRYAKVAGLLLMVGSVYLFYLLYWQLDFNYLAKSLPGLTTLMWEWLLQAFQIFFTIMSAVVFLMGFLVLVRPSQLKPLEEKANFWISTRQKMQFMSDNMGQADKLLAQFPRQFGAIILVAGAIVLLNMNKFNI